MSRLYAVEPTFSITGAAADHRLPLAAGEVPAFVAALANEVTALVDGTERPESEAPWGALVHAAAEDLVKHRGAGVVAAGRRQSPAVHAAVHRLNAKLDNVGKTVTYTAEPNPERPLHVEAIVELVRAMNAGELYILDAGPSLHGYHADNCRTFAVDGEPTAAQTAAWECIDAVFAALEAEIRPGRPAVEVYQIADAYFKQEGYAGMSHHLGHGIGLRPHEPPELNPEYDAVFGVGDVFTVEPGLYNDELRAGIRLEENYLVTETGVERLTSYPRALC